MHRNRFWRHKYALWSLYSTLCHPYLLRLPEIPLWYKWRLQKILHVQLVLLMNNLFLLSQIWPYPFTSFASLTLFSDISSVFLILLFLPPLLHHSELQSLLFPLIPWCRLIPLCEYQAHDWLAGFLGSESLLSCWLIRRLLSLNLPLELAVLLKSYELVRLRVEPGLKG